MMSPNPYLRRQNDNKQVHFSSFQDANRSSSPHRFRLDRVQLQHRVAQRPKKGHHCTLSLRGYECIVGQPNDNHLFTQIQVTRNSTTTTRTLFAYSSQTYANDFDFMETSRVEYQNLHVATYPRLIPDGVNYRDN